jgi:phosphoribosyl 1,2-cyclic phosphodiesterase
MALRVSVLGSGSRGNATFVKTSCVRLLIDAGLSRKEIAKRLESIGEDPDGIDAVLITHEHTDHASGLKTLLKELPVRVFATGGTLRALQMQDFGSDASNASFNIVPICAGLPFTLGDAEVLPFRVPHDAAEPVAFSLTSGGVKVTQLTDIGYLPDEVAEKLHGSHVLILESNHDLEMLRVGPYPWNLKQRLMGRYGHLSNEAVAHFFRDRYDGEADHVMLAHLSAKNNHPEIARQETARALRDRGFSNVRLTVTSQDEPTVPVQL